ncbi:MAG: DUF4012 domain-containing protein [Patescibacteria group bacterium]
MASIVKAKKVAIKIKPQADERSPFVVNLRPTKPLQSKQAKHTLSPALAARDALKNRVGQFLETLPNIGKRISTAMERGLAGFEKRATSLTGRARKPSLPLAAKTMYLAKRARFTPKTPVPFKWQKPLITPETLSSLRLISWKRLAEHTKAAAPKAVWEYGAMLFVAIIILSLPLQALRAWSSAKTAQTELTASINGVGSDVILLKQTIAAANLLAAGETLETIRARVERLESALQGLWPLSAVPPLRTFRSLLKKTSTSIQEISLTTDVLRQLEKNPSDLTSALHTLHERILSLSTHIESIEKLLQKLRIPFLEKSHRIADSLGAIAASASTVTGSLEQITAALPIALGEISPKRYLLLFQNQNELRPTGGFIGSIATIEIEKGAVTKWSLPGGGSYDLQGQFTARLASPHPLWLINPRFEFQDMNWFPDFPTSARKLADTYEKAAGDTVDGVIAITGHVLENLLGILGPIEVPEFNKTVTQENFMEVTQSAVELDYDKTSGKPKAFLGKLFEILSGRLASMTGEERTKVLLLAFKGLTEKDIQLFTRDGKFEETLSRLGWAGDIQDAPLDSLLLVSTNIGGGKTDGAITRDIEKTTTIRKNGTLSSAVRITFTHHGDPSNFWTRKRNTSYLRLYVPQGSILQSAHGFWAPPEYLFETPTGILTQDPDVRSIERNAATGPADTLIMEENEKTVFGNWMQIDIGQEKTVEFTYDLPSGLVLREPAGMYSLLLQKQAGATATFTHTIKKEMADGEEIISTETFPIDTDRFLTTITH